MPRKKKFQPEVLIGYINEYALALKQARVITATDIAVWLKNTKALDIRYQTLTRCREAKEYINAYNQNVREAQLHNSGQVVTYTTMDIQAEAKRMEDPEERCKRLVELDNELEQMAYAYSRLHQEKTELELQMKMASARQETQKRDIEKLQEENRELIKKLDVSEEKVRKLKKEGQQYLAYIKQFLYEPVMKAQLLQSGLVKAKEGGKQVLPKEFQPLMDDSSSVEKTIQNFIHILNTSDKEILFEEPQEPAAETVKNDTKVLPFPGRIISMFKDLED